MKEIDKKIIAVSLVIVIAVAACGVYFLLQDDDGADAVKVTGRLVVYGNANNDDYIDANDVHMIERILSGEEEWDPVENPFADTDNDGAITLNDVDLLKKMINKESCTVYYSDRWGDVLPVSYPITGSIGTMYWQQAELSVMFGLWDRVTACGSGSLNEVSYPGWTSKIPYGLGYDVDPEVVISSGVRTLICYTQTDNTVAEIKELVKSTGYELNILAVNQDDLPRCIATYGFLLGCEDKAKEWLATEDYVKEYLEEKLGDVKKEDQPSIVLVMLYGTATTESIRVLGISDTGSANNLYKSFMKVPNANIIRADLSLPSYGTYVSSEWFLQEDPDYIVFVASTGFPSTFVESELLEYADAKCQEVWGKTNAYKNGNVIMTSNGMMGSFPTNHALLAVLSQIYDEIDADMATELYNSYFEEFALFTPEQRPQYKVHRIGGTA